MIGKTAAAALVAVFVFLGGFTIARRTIEAVGNDLTELPLMAALIVAVTAASITTYLSAIVTRAADYDAVVIGSHGSDVVGRLFVGDVADVVFRRAPVPVTVVR